MIKAIIQSITNPNPNPEKYIKTIEGYALKPRQCHNCKGLFIPLTESSLVCSGCTNSPEHVTRSVNRLRAKINYYKKIGDPVKLKEYMFAYIMLTGKVISFRK